MDVTKLKTYFWSAVGVLGVVFFWAGVWDGLGNLYFLANPLISLATGTVILIASGIAFGKIKLGGEEKSIHSLIHKVHRHPQKHEFHIKYHDKAKKKHVLLKGSQLKNIEKSFLVLGDKGKETFIPMHRVSGILHKGKEWKGEKVEK